MSAIRGQSQLIKSAYKKLKTLNYPPTIKFPTNLVDAKQPRGLTRNTKLWQGDEITPHKRMNTTLSALCRGAQKAFNNQPTAGTFALMGLAITTLGMSPAEAATTIYSDRASFEASLGASVIDDYSNPGYTFLQSNEVMSSVLGETVYASTGFLPSEINIVDQNQFYYCAGCNGSFTLSFITTSVGTPDGVFGVGFEFFNDAIPSQLYDAFVTFGDGSQLNIPLPFAITPNSMPLDTFFGITSSLSIKSISIGLPNGQPTNQTGSFGIDNLTIGRPVPGPFPLLGVGAAFGLSRKLRKRIKGAPPVASAIG